MRGSISKNEPVTLINNIFLKVSRALIVKTLRRLRTVFEAQSYDLNNSREVRVRHLLPIYLDVYIPKKD